MDAPVHHDRKKPGFAIDHNLHPGQDGGPRGSFSERDTVSSDFAAFSDTSHVLRDPSYLIRIPTMIAQRTKAPSLPLPFALSPEASSAHFIAHNRNGSKWNHDQPCRKPFWSVYSHPPLRTLMGAHQTLEWMRQWTCFTLL